MNQLKFGRFAPLDYARQEAFNTLCTNLSFSGEKFKKIMITSCHVSEGKTFLSMNILRTMAGYGKKVVLVEADLRRNSIAAHYKLESDSHNGIGLAHYLSGMAKADEVIFRTNLPGVWIVPAGRNVTNPVALLNSPRFRELLNHLAAHMDYVLVDAPAVLPVIDAAEIAKSCDGTLLVVSYNAVHRQDLIAAKEQLEQTGCPIIGTALNQVEFDSCFHKKYDYYDSKSLSNNQKKHSRKKIRHLAERK